MAIQETRLITEEVERILREELSEDELIEIGHYYGLFGYEITEPLEMAKKFSIKRRDIVDYLQSLEKKVFSILKEVSTQTYTEWIPGEENHEKDPSSRSGTDAAHSSLSGTKGDFHE